MVFTSRLSKSAGDHLTGAFSYPAIDTKRPPVQWISLTEKGWVNLTEWRRGKCKSPLPLSDVERFLQGRAVFQQFQSRLQSVATSCSGGVGSSSSSCFSPSPSSPEDKMSIKVREFKDKVIEAFNLCCPCCKKILAKIEGCNAATCEGCGTRFCYLCLKAEADSTSAHAHARAHSGNYWEQRDGHTGQVPEPGQKYQESEKYTVTETHPISSNVATVNYTIKSFLSIAGIFARVFSSPYL